MCNIDRKTYLRSDGTQSTVETIRRCANATGPGLCDDVQVRQPQTATLIERAPRSSPKEASEFITEGFNGRRIVYREVGGVMRRISKRSSRGPGTSASSPSSTASRSSPGTTYTEVRPSPSTPPSAVSSDHRRVSFRDDTKGGSVTNEDEPRRYRPASVESVSSVSAVVEEPLNDRADVDYRTTMREGYGSSRGSPVSPALSDLPRIASRPKHDSAKDFHSSNKQYPEVRPRPETSESARRQEEKADAAAVRRRQQKENDVQAELERSRLAASERRQAERVEAAAESSRERHRRGAAAALEGQIRAAQRQQVDSELEQMARERRRAEERRSTSYGLPTTEQHPYGSPLRSPISPMSPRGPMSLPPRLPRSAIVHNNYPPPIDPTLRPSGFTERDAGASGRRQARTDREYQSSNMDRGGPQQQTQRLECAMRDMSFDGDFVLYDEDDGYAEYEPLPSPSGRRGGDRARRSRPGRSEYYQ